MRFLIQKVSQASVTVDGHVVGAIKDGLVVLVGVTHEDTMQAISYLVDKTVNLRLFADGDKNFDKSVGEINGSVLVVSQFTLYGNCDKGRRPSFDKAAKPEQAKQLYEAVVRTFKDKGIPVATGQFQAKMKVDLINEGPVTILLEK